ncbi:MAG: hypothetical protein V3T16_03150 [Gemmatimonadales bacterium]
MTGTPSPVVGLAVPPAVQDSVVVESPLPGGTAAFFRFLFNFPQWAQIAGFFVGLVVAFFVVRYIWRRREPIITWIKTRSRRIKWALGGGVVAGVLVAIAVGGATWNYTQHDNGFCTGCHIMEDPFGKFASGAGRHEDLQCHDCHRQGITTSMWQLFLWVAERPEEITAHAPVPNERCDECHSIGADETWERIATTAGHRVHLESDSVDLAEVMCVTCHGEEIHAFVPVNATCGQSGCHDTDETDVVLGKMAAQTDQHCVQCHQFTADVPLLATYDSARGTLIPTLNECFSCHEMENLLVTFRPRLDPHSGTCGLCHRPHTQELVEQAAETCAECHDDWRDTPFHVGVNHREDGESCLTCHPHHAAKVDPSDCVGCHEAVNETGVNRHAPLPFDTTAALLEASLPQRVYTPPEDLVRLIEPEPEPAAEEVAQLEADWQRQGKGDVLPGPSPPMPRLEPQPADTFPHDRHESVACISCHSTEAGRGPLTFEQPRGCQICHHRGPSTNDCAACHESDELEPPLGVAFAIAVDEHEPRYRTVDFEHPIHAEGACIDCHQSAVTMTVDSATAACQSCHDQHHTEASPCATCHRTEAVLESHTVTEGHEGCDACHTEATVAALTPERSFCMACHEEDVDHYPEKTCTVCHLQDKPEDYRRFLLGAGR